MGLGCPAATPKVLVAGLGPNRPEVVPLPKVEVVAGLAPNRPPPVLEAPPNVVVEAGALPNSPPPAGCQNEGDEIRLDLLPVFEPNVDPVAPNVGRA